jgi:hypothetical protein
MEVCWKRGVWEWRYIDTEDGDLGGEEEFCGCEADA